MRTLVTDISTYTLAKLDVIVIYGLGAFILYVVGLVAIIAYEVRQAKSTQGVTSMLPYITKSFVYVFGWMVIITFFYLVLITVMPAGDGNPANGIYGFWFIDWLNPDVMKSLDDGVLKDNETQLSAAQFIVLTMMVTKFTYHFLLLAFFVMIFSFVHSIPSLKAKQQNDEISYGYIGNFALSAVASVIVFQMLTGIMGAFLSGLLATADSLNKLASTSSSGTAISIMDDMFYFVKVGIERGFN